MNACLIKCEGGLTQNWINEYDKCSFRFLKSREFLYQYSNKAIKFTRKYLHFLREVSWSES
jgi:hypothetical protein